ncbi:MAG: recombination mediator RecR [Alphaproteobacteria bacterium]|nr:recombination mediator RecR [Alphaproteobacteria bacterium]
MSYSSRQNDGPLDSLIRALAGLPGLGPRSARRIALHLLTNRQKAMAPLMQALEQTAAQVRICTACGNLDLSDPCRICTNPQRQQNTLCVVAGVADLWAIERTGAFKGRYHILGGILSALDGITPDMLTIRPLLERLAGVEEVILALAATVDGQATAHYLSDRLQDARPDLRITRLAHGVPVGGELDYLDEGTIMTALKSRSRV